MQMARPLACRLCASEVERSRFIDVFGIEGRKQNLSSRLSKLLVVPVDQDDGLSPFVCRNCKLKFSTLETKLETFRAQARSCFDVSRVKVDDGQRKRTKDTSGDGISPFTSRSRPPAKRFTATTRCLFPQDESKLLLIAME